MAAPAGALDGLRVVELGEGVPGAFAARLLGDLGADVVKVESPDGDAIRALEPFGEDAEGRPVALLFEHLNWGKRGAVLADDELPALLARADVVVDALGPGVLRRTVDLDALRAANPRLVVTAISSFGAEGPYAQRRATDLVLQAMSGIMQISGTSDREPLKHGLRQSLYCAGLNAAYVSLAGVLSARATGVGADIDLSVLECLTSELVLNEAHYAFMGAVQGRRPPIQDPLAGDPLPASDGWVSLQTSGLISAERLAELFDDPRLAAPEFAGSESRTRHADRLTRILVEHLAGEASADFFVRASRAGYLSGFVQGAQELLDCPQLASREVFHAFEEVTARGRPVRFPAVVAALSRTPARVAGRAPGLGEHTEQVRSELAREPEPAAPSAPRAGGPAGADPSAADRGPLHGLRVLDLSSVFAVPYMGALLADLGAEVIKVEAPRRLDQTRSWFGPFYENDPGPTWWDRSATFQVINRGKRSLALDLKTPEGRDVLRELVRRSDVLLDNFTPRVMRDWGMTYDELSELHPGLVMLSNTGYGSTGPWAAFRAQGTSLEATMGITQVTGYPDGKPSKVGQSYPDFLACWSGLLGVLAALVERDRSGRGQWVDLGMYQLGVAVIPEALLAHQADGAELPRRGNEDLGAVVSGLFPAAGDDRWLAVSVADEHELLVDPHLRARGLYEWLDYGPELGWRPLIGRPYRWSDPTARPAIRRPGPDFGEANGSVLRELLGLDEQRIAALYAAGAVADAPVGPLAEQAPIDLATLLAARALTRVDADYAERLAALAEPAPSGPSRATS